MCALAFSFFTFVKFEKNFSRVKFLFRGVSLFCRGRVVYYTTQCIVCLHASLLIIDHFGKDLNVLKQVRHGRMSPDYML